MFAGEISFFAFAIMAEAVGSLDIAAVLSVVGRNRVVVLVVMGQERLSLILRSDCQTIETNNCSNYLKICSFYTLSTSNQ